MRTELKFAIVTTMLIVFAIIIGCSKSFVVYKSPREVADTTEVYIPRKVKGADVDTLVPITFSVEVEDWWEEDIQL